jgi:ATP-binding cassette subfamily C (CFTR/MRP) protein 5
MENETTWPSEGTIEVKNASVRYRENTPIVLNDISFKIESRQKVGLVGRTGSGKSTFMLCMTRILELDQVTEGSICVDSYDISKMGLHNLRKKIAIIPQEPHLL